MVVYGCMHNTTVDQPPTLLISTAPVNILGINFFSISVPTWARGPSKCDRKKTAGQHGVRTGDKAISKRLGEGLMIGARSGRQDEESEGAADCVNNPRATGIQSPRQELVTNCAVKD